MGQQQSGLNGINNNNLNLITSIYKDLLNNYNYSVDSIDYIVFNYNKSIYKHNFLYLHFDLYHIDVLDTIDSSNDLDNLMSILSDKNFIFKEYKILKNQLILCFSSINKKLLDTKVSTLFPLTNTEDKTILSIKTILLNFINFNSMVIFIVMLNYIIISNNVIYKYYIDDKITLINIDIKDFMIMASIIKNYFGDYNDKSYNKKIELTESIESSDEFTNTPLNTSNFVLSPKLSSETINYIKSNLVLYRGAAKNIKRGYIELTEIIIEELNKIIPGIKLQNNKLNIRLMLNDTPKHRDKILDTDEKSVDNYLFYLNKVQGQLIVGDNTIDVEEGLGIKLSGEEHGFINSDPKEIRYILGPFDINGSEVGISNSTSKKKQIDKFTLEEDFIKYPGITNLPSEYQSSAIETINAIITDINNNNNTNFFEILTALEFMSNKILGIPNQYSEMISFQYEAEDQVGNYTIYYTNKQKTEKNNLIGIKLTDVDSIYLNSNIIYPIKVSSKKNTQTFLNKKVFTSYFLKVFLYILLIVTILLILYILNTIYKFI
jgi:hypothetical protein